MKNAHILALVGLVGCSVPEMPEAPVQYDAAVEQPSVAPQASLVLLESPTAHHPLARGFLLELEAPAAVTVTCDEVTAPYERHQVTSQAATRVDLTLYGLKADTTYSCTARAEDGSGRV